MEYDAKDRKLEELKKKYEEVSKLVQRKCEDKLTYAPNKKKEVEHELKKL